MIKIKIRRFLKMSLLSCLSIIFGLSLFEIISSLDNAVINADVLGEMSEKYRRYFLIYGIIIAVFLVRGLLPWLIIWLANPSLGPINSFLATFSNNPEFLKSVEKSGPLIFMTGGIFLIFVFLHWLFLEPKHFGLWGEKWFSRQGAWFFAIVSLLLSLIIFLGIKREPMLGFTAALGSSIFFIVHGFRNYAQQMESEALLKKTELSDLSKLLYLEVLDASFSLDGVIGAFAFTLSVPLIILGNGLGALVVREMTIKGVEQIKKYPFLKNGAMYSIFFLGLVMVLKSFGLEFSEYVCPLFTLFIITFFFLKSKKYLDKNQKVEDF
jgi:hypothetical protein